MIDNAHITCEDRWKDKFSEVHFFHLMPYINICCSQMIIDLVWGSLLVCGIDMSVYKFVLAWQAFSFRYE